MGLALHSLAITAWLAVLPASQSPRTPVAPLPAAKPQVTADRVAVQLVARGSGLAVRTPASTHATTQSSVVAGRACSQVRDGSGRLILSVSSAASRRGTPRLLSEDGKPMPAAPGTLSNAADDADAPVSSILWREPDGSETEIVTYSSVPIELVGAEPVPGAQVDATAGSEAPVHRGVPLEFSLAPTEPNPFSNETTVRFTLPKAGKVNVSVFDVSGRRIATVLDEERAPGPHTVQYRPRAHAAGLYLLRLTYAPEDGATSRQLARPIVLLP